MSIFVNEDYSKYKYLVGVSDNYIILSNKKNVSGSWEYPVEYDVIYQYLYPSTYVIEDTKTTTQELTFETIKSSTDFWDRADSIQIFNCSILVIFCALFIINILTRIVKRGGLLG